MSRDKTSVSVCCRVIYAELRIQFLDWDVERYPVGNISSLAD